MDCAFCKESREIVSRHIYESTLDRLERINRRWFIAWLITFVLLVGCVAGFIWYESQWEYFETTVTQENDGGFNSYIGNDGDINYGDEAIEEAISDTDNNN